MAANVHVDDLVKAFSEGLRGEGLFPGETKPFGIYAIHLYTKISFRCYEEFVLKVVRFVDFASSSDTVDVAFRGKTEQPNSSTRTLPYSKRKPLSHETTAMTPLKETHAPGKHSVTQA